MTIGIRINNSSKYADYDSIVKRRIWTFNSTFFLLLFFPHTQISAARISIIGDSLSVVKNSGLGNQLDSKLRSEGHKLHTVAACGSKPENYLAGNAWKTDCGFLYRNEKSEETYLEYLKAKKNPQEIPSLASVLKFSQNQKPDLLVIQQGTNLFGYLQKSPPDVKGLKMQIHDLLKDFQNKNARTRCLWVAPPKITKFNGQEIVADQSNLLFQTIEESIDEFSKFIGLQKKQRCELIDSRDFTDPPDQWDGTHFKKSNQNKKWVEHVHQKINRMLKEDAFDFSVVHENANTPTRVLHE